MTTSSASDTKNNTHTSLRFILPVYFPPATAGKHFPARTILHLRPGRLRESTTL